MEELQFCAFFAASGLPHSFIIMHQNRYQQCIGAFILQAASESAKVESLQPWISHTFPLKAGGALNIFYIFNTDVQHFVCGIVFSVASTQDVTTKIIFLNVFYVEVSFVFEFRGFSDKPTHHLHNKFNLPHMLAATWCHRLLLEVCQGFPLSKYIFVFKCTCYICRTSY